jgi:hypothetical protein
MSIAAVPKYLGQDFRDASPGMRFGLYVKGWEPDFRLPQNKVPSASSAAAKKGEWQAEDKIAVACWLEARMRQAKGQWKESSQAKRPEKDKEYQNTLLVKAWLDGK